MKGHEPIIAMRRNGIAPKIVFVNDFPDVCAKDWHLHGDHATVSVDGDAVGVLDLRFLIGLMVSITGSTETRAKALAEKAKDAGATTVASMHCVKDGKRWTTSWSEVWKKEGDHGRILG